METKAQRRAETGMGSVARAVGADRVAEAPRVVAGADLATGAPRAAAASRTRAFACAAVATLMVAGLLLLAACGKDVQDQVTQTSQVSLAESAAERLTGSAPGSDVAAVSESIAAFGADLYRVLALREPKANLVLSPTSVATALAMTYAGAAGTTAQQMAATLHFSLANEALHQAFNSLDLALASRNREPQGPEHDDGVLVKTANSPWAQQDCEFRPEYLDTLASDYGASVRLVDYSTAKGAEAARQAINAWVAEQTGGKIVDLVPPDYRERTPDPIVLMLVNAIYLDAAWAVQFPPRSTEDREFTTLDGTKVTTPMMFKIDSLPYAFGEGWQAVELPYVGGELAMLLIVPDAGRFDEIESLLGEGLVADVAGALAEGSEVRLLLPKFEFRMKAGLRDALRALGMTDAFDRDRADFSGMSTTLKNYLYIADVVHEAYIAVDEKGTEAAAATGVTMAASASTVTLQPIELTIDRPFIFALRDRETGAILFLGRVTDPTK